MSKNPLRAALMAASMVAAGWPLLAAAAPLSLVQALDLAVERSEATRAARAGVASAAESAQAAGEMPDPMLRVGIENLPVSGRDRFNLARDSQTMKRVGISQEWRSRDQRAARQGVAEAQRRREQLAVRAAAAEVRLQTALAYVEAWFGGQALVLSTLGEQRADEELGTARARLAAAASGSAEVLALAAARGMAADDSADARQQQVAAQLGLARWLGRPVDDALFSLVWPALPVALPTEAAYVANHPDVQALQAELDTARRSAALAAAERHPNWTWELSYGQRSGLADMVSFGVSIPLPIAPAARQDRETAARLARADQAEAALAEAGRAAAAEYRALTADAQSLRLRITRYQLDVVAPAAQRTAAQLAAYRSNQAPLADLFEARRAEVDAQRKSLTLQRELAQAEARLAFRPLLPGDAL